MEPFLGINFQQDDNNNFNTRINIITTYHRYNKSNSILFLKNNLLEKAEPASKSATVIFILVF